MKPDLNDVMKAVDLFHTLTSPVCIELLWNHISKQSVEWRDLFHSLK